MVVGVGSDREIGRFPEIILGSMLGTAREGAVTYRYACLCFIGDHESRSMIQDMLIKVPSSLVHSALN